MLDELLEGEVEEGEQLSESDFNTRVIIEERELSRVREFMSQIDQRQKTLVFCATQDHAALVRDLINQVSDSKQPDYCHRVTAEDGALAGMESGGVFVDHTTVSAKVTRELHAAANDAGVSFVDAPISGGQAGAENGALSVMCGGDQAAYDRAEPVIDANAGFCRRIGESGAGQMTKMCNQIAIAGLVQGLSEALHFAEKSGLDGRAVVEVISQGAAGSWQMQNRYETMLDDHFDHGFAVDWMRKDLGICLAAADEFGASLPVTALVDQFYKDVQKMGGGRWDTSSLFKRLRAMG